MFYCEFVFFLILFFFFFFNDTATTEIYTLSLHDALPISPGRRSPGRIAIPRTGRERRTPDRRDVGLARHARDRLTRPASRRRGAVDGVARRRRRTRALVCATDAALVGGELRRGVRGCGAGRGRRRRRSRVRPWTRHVAGGSGADRSC